MLLVLHGGPGWPNAVFSLPLRSWEWYFTVVQWDQRGAGKILGRSSSLPAGELAFERRVSDAVELAGYLRRHLQQDRLVLLAESLGTLTGLPLALRRPDLFAALVVTDLYVDLLRNGAQKYWLTLERLRIAGNHRGVAALEVIGADPARWYLRAMWRSRSCLQEESRRWDAASLDSAQPAHGP